MRQGFMNIIPAYILNHFRNYTTPLKSVSKDGLPFWQEKILLYLLYILMIFAPVAYIPSMILSVKVGLLSIAIVDTAGYAFLIYLFINKNLSIRFRIKSVLLVAYSLGVLLLLIVGPLGAGYLWLFIVPVIAAIFLELKSAIIALITNAITMVLIGVVHHLGLTSEAAKTGFDPASWAVISANLIFLNIITTVSIMFIIRGLEKSLSDQKNISASLIQRSNELKIAKEEAEKSELIKSNFLAQMSHEIRTPINTILSYISLLKEKVDGTHDKEIEDYFETINRGSYRIIRTIDMILNMSEIQAGCYKANREDLSLFEDILNPIINELKLPAQKKNLELYVVNSVSQSELINADRYSITQIFVNLLDNAIKYTHDGKIEVRVSEDNDAVIIAIIDTGIGMSYDYLKNLFNPFSQEEGGYSRRYEGSGLGLSLVKNYCKLNDAELLVESAKGIGSKFTVIFKKNIGEKTILFSQDIKNHSPDVDNTFESPE
jgi:signal transduction histidine kinase